MKFEDLSDNISNIIEKNANKNYQFVMLRYLLITGSSSKKDIAIELQNYNQDVKKDYRSAGDVFKVLTELKKDMVTEEHQMFSINNFDELSDEQRYFLINKCNEKILMIKKTKNSGSTPTNLDMTWKNAAFKVLKEENKLLHRVKITDLILERHYVKEHNALTPYETVARDIDKDIESSTESLFKKSEPGIYGLNDSNFGLTKMNEKNNLEILNKIVSKFRENRESISAGWTLGGNSDNEKQRKAFVSKYSLDKIKKLTLENYAEGKTDSSGERTKNNFCSELSNLDQYGRLEGRDGPGIYGIYIRKQSQEYVVPTNVNKKLFSGKSPEEAYSIINQGIIEILQYGEASNFSKLSEQNVIDNRFKSKILAVYYPEKNLMIHAKSELSGLGIDFGLFEKNEFRKKSSYEIQQSLLKFKESQQNLKDLNNLEYSHILWYYAHGIKKDLKLTTSEYSTAMTEDNYDRALKWKPNLILYGPPGTGKTYHANEIAKRITRNQISKIGICWPTDKDEDKIEDFQNVIEDNEKVLWGVNWSIDQVKKSDFPIKGYIYYKQNIIAIATISNCTLHEETNDADLKLRPEKWHNGQDYKNYLHFTSVNRCVPFSHKKLKLNDSTKIIPDIIQQRVYVKQKTNFIRKVTFHPSYSYEDFVEGYRPNVKGTDKNPYKLENGIFKQICNDAKDDDPKTKYVIIIDEINRGNIPKILGELITLIEKDKRNLENSLKLTYSKDDFFVPENLIIIGTMNTADKSLMQMDDALKRRFVFEELMPDTDLLEKELKKNNVPHAENYSTILKRINEKITGDEKDDEAMIQFRDRQIGHSYFWKLQNDDDLQKVIKYDIIPLLQDYFYGDYSKIREILGNEKADKFTIIGKDNRTTPLVNDVSQSSKLREELLDILE